VREQPHRLLSVLAIIVALAAISLAVYGQVNNIGGQRLALSEQVSKHAAGEAGLANHTTVPPVVFFRAINAGYALTPSCPATTPAPTADTCYYRLWVTSDGGSSWQGYTTPVPADRFNLKPNLVPFGDNGIAIELKGHRWLSVDNGLHWRTAPRVSSVLTRSPPDAISSLHCTSSGCHIQLLLPDGKTARLSAQPPLVRASSASWQPGCKQTMAVTGWDSANNPRVVVSTDSGASWRVLHLSPLTTPHQVAVLADNRILVLDGDELNLFDLSGKFIGTLTKNVDFPQFSSITTYGATIVGQGSDNQLYVTQTSTLVTSGAWHQFDLNVVRTS
jgi:hypothetical protein